MIKKVFCTAAYYGGKMANGISNKVDGHPIGQSYLFQPLCPEKLSESLYENERDVSVDAVKREEDLCVELRKPGVVSQTVYAGGKHYPGFIAFDTKKKLSNQGQFAELSYGLLPESEKGPREVVIRRLKLTNEKEAGRPNEKEAEQLIDTMRSLCGQDGIIPAFAVLKIKDAVVSFHPVYEMDMLDFLKDNELTTEEQFFYAAELFRVGLSLSLCKKAHRDFKPDNILVNPHREYCKGSNRLGLTDLDWVQSFDDKNNYGGRGTDVWMAPECYVSEKIEPEKLDSWALGLILLMLQSPKKKRSFAPWQAFQGNPVKVYKNISQWMASFFIKQSVAPQNIKVLVSEMVVVDPARRCTIQEAYLKFEKIWRDFLIEQEIKRIVVQQQPVALD